MLAQAHPVPLTEENLNRHQKEATNKRIPLERSKSGNGLRSAGDGESIEFVSDETLKESLNEQESDEKNTSLPVDLPSDSTTTVPLQNMDEPSKANPLPDSNANEEETSSQSGSKQVSAEKEDLSEEKEAIGPSDQEEGEGGFDSEDNGESEMERSGNEEESDEESSSSLDSDSDVEIPAKANQNDEEDADDSNDSAASSRSSSPVVSDDDDDDDDEDSVDDDEEEEEEEAEEGMKSDDELTHYTSSLNASVSSIPTLYDDMDEALESPESSAEAEQAGASPGQGNEEGEQQDTGAAAQEVTEGDKAKVEKEEEACVEEQPLEEEPAGSDYSPPGSRQVSGRSATPKTVVVSEFDDVESTIFDRREESALGSSSRNKLTTSPNSGRSEVSIKNWAGFGNDYVTSVDGVTEVAVNHLKAKNGKRLKTRKMRNINKANRVKKKTSREKKLKRAPTSKETVKKTDNKSIIKRQLIRQHSSSSDNSDTGNKQQKKIVRRKRKPAKQVSFDNTHPTKAITSDSAIFGSRTESRGEEHSSPKPPESEHSDRASSRWSAVESEQASTASPRPASSASMAQSTRSSMSVSQRSRQTSLVEEMTAVNYPPFVQGKRVQLPTLPHHRPGPPKQRTKKSQSAVSKTTTKTSGGESSMMRRILSANRNKVSRLHNILEELQQEVEELKDENKSLKRVSHRQEKQIKKIDEEEASLPLLLQRHSAEMRTLKERLRKNQETLHRKEKESKERDTEIQKLRDKISDYRHLAQDKKLEERAALAKKLENLQDEMSTKDKKITDLEKSITLKDKARQREMKEQKDRYKQAREELKRVQEDFRSLRDRLKEKEKELDDKNIYHYHITQKKKKGATLAALPAGSAANHAPAITAPAVHVEKAADSKEKRTNVFLTNAASDSGSVITDEGKHEGKKPEMSAVRQEEPAILEPAREVKRDDEDRLRREGEERRRLEEDERRRRIEKEEDERKRKEKDEEERRRREEEHERRKREEEEELRKQREEQERLRKQREEEENKRIEEEAETRRKKDLLLARMRAIDSGNEPPNGVVKAGGAVPPLAEDKPKKLPIFLQSDKPARTEPQQPKPSANVAYSDDDVLSDVSGGRKKMSASSKQSRYSYDFKQTVENLHHGLPAHAAQELAQNDAHHKQDTKDSLSDDLSFGSYKPTLGRRAAAKRDNKDKDDLSFGGYNPSFGAKKDTTRKNSGLDFGAGKKNSSEKEQSGVVFGDYNPSFAASSSKPYSSQPNGDIGGITSPPRGRRPKGFAGKEESIFGDDLFTREVAKPTGNPLFGDSSFKKDKSAYPWENKVNVTRRSSQEDSLLPRRKRIQSIGKSAEQNVRAVDNALDDVDDEIEEVIL